MAKAKVQDVSVALLRGINVGGKNILPMKGLAAIFAEAGCVDVRTYIQSGNVIFRVAPGLLKTLAADISSRIAERFSLRVPVILRTRAELADTIRNNPFLSHSEEKFLYVMFLAGQPDGDGISKLDLRRSPPDEFVVRNREIYLNLRNGAAKSKLTNAWFDTRLKTISTARNWRTVLTLYDLTGPE